MPINNAAGLPWTELFSDRCPHCGAALIGDLIPEEDRRPGGPDRYRRDIGVETNDYDGILYWTCPDCDAAWPGWLGRGARADLARRRAAEHNQRVAETPDQERRVRAAAAVEAPRVDEILALAGLTSPRA
ncbi:hypothetical protein F1D05_10405 [Kribbella qitaiheensis]|uniref:Uncharacterized protein n=1 Tax=Kribbella qitaiheensis TaxID=1544730 RepID=A0A7G6WW68_9ACTN|nr:hypothetical protein [Kribbella qitaiheensis]QNE18233.1 hypothetical protein F1D05_10405 [Kribbella qitaiheensis]